MMRKPNIEPRLFDEWQDSTKYSPDNGHTQEQLISIEQMHVVYRQTKTAVLGNGVAATLLITILWGVSDHSVIISWLAFVVSVLVARYVLYAFYKRGKSVDENVEFWVRVYAIFAFLTGAAWGATGVLFFAPDSTLYHVIISMLVLGISTGSVIGYSVNLKVASAFFLPCILPISAYMLYIGDRLHILLGLGLFAYAIIAMITLFPIHRSILSAIKTNLELNQELAKRKQVETQLSESERKFKNLFKYSPDPCWIIDENNLFNLCNTAAAKTLGYSNIEELASVHPSEVSPEFQPDGRESFEKANEMMAIAHSKGVHRFEWSHRRKNGECFPVEVTLSRLKSSGEVSLYCIWRDITERKKDEEELALQAKKLLDNEIKFKTMFNTSPDPMWIMNDNGYFILCNDAAAKTLEYDSPEQLESTHPADLSPEFQPDGQTSMNKAIKTMALVRSKGMHRFEWEHRRRNGECFAVDVTLSRITLDNKDQFFCIWHDISESKKNEQALHELNEKLESLSFQDGLTGVANRRMFDTRINQEWGRCIREQQPLSLIMIDIDYFKQYNDHYGHQSGDECLKEVAQKLAELAKRTVDLCARYGGEEFVLLLPNTSLKQAIHLAEKCRENIYQLNIPHEASSICDAVTISVGVGSITPVKGSISSSLIEDADKALYLAKENGRNIVKIVC